jgi:Holliday junction resolvasome RuvABC endonuclease subunit
MIVLGIDPDLHHTGLSMVKDGVPQDLACVTVDRKLVGPEAVMAMARALPAALHSLSKLEPVVAVVENQQIYTGTQGRARPDDILKLGQVAGAALAAIEHVFCVDKVFFPKPQRWKGSVPKLIHQRRILSRLGWETVETKTTVRPKGNPLGFHLAATHWSHVLDAIGLALWGEKQR